MVHGGREIKIRYMEFPQEVRGSCPGFVTAKFDGLYLIVIDSTQAPIVQRHTLGHELAHIYLDHLDRFDQHIMDQEREANRLAWHYYRQWKSGEIGADQLPAAPAPKQAQP